PSCSQPSASARPSPDPRRRGRRRRPRPGRSQLLAVVLHAVAPTWPAPPSHDRARGRRRRGRWRGGPLVPRPELAPLDLSRNTAPVDAPADRQRALYPGERRGRAARPSPRRAVAPPGRSGPQTRGSLQSSPTTRLAATPTSTEVRAGRREGDVALPG